MSTECLKCGHLAFVEEPSDLAECPKCGVIYKKYEAVILPKALALNVAVEEYARDLRRAGAERKLHIAEVRRAKEARELMELQNKENLQQEAVSPKILKTSKASFLIYWVLGALGLVAAGYFIDFRIPILVALAVFCVWVVRKAIQGSREQEQKRVAALSSAPYQHCMTCGHDFKHGTAALRGSTTLEVALWILILWPVALIYSIWRRLKSGKAKTACLVCASTQVVPASSPAAVAHKRALGVSDV